MPVSLAGHTKPLPRYDGKVSAPASHEGRPEDAAWAPSKCAQEAHAKMATFTQHLGKVGHLHREGIVGSRHDAHRRGMSQAGLPPRSVGATSNANMAAFARSSWESWPSWPRRNRRESPSRAPTRDVASRLAAAEHRRHQQREDGHTLAVILGKLAIFARNSKSDSIYRSATTTCCIVGSRLKQSQRTKPADLKPASYSRNV